VLGELPFLDPVLTRHWRYYLLLESEFETALRYVEPHIANAGTFSLEFARHLLATCAQFETIAKLLCVKRVPGSAPEGIKAIRSALAQWQPNFVGWRTRFYPRNDRIAPFREWTEDRAPAWWRAYNEFKHDPTIHLQVATLENATAALAGLGLLTIAYLGVNAQPGASRLFDLNWA